MIKSLSKVVLASFLLTGVAQAANLYKDSSNSVSVDVTAKAYAAHDNYSVVNSSSTREMAPVEMMGLVKMGLTYKKQFNSDLSAKTYVRFDLPIFGYSKSEYGYGKSSVESAQMANQMLSTFDYIEYAYQSINSLKYGNLVIGRYQGFYSKISDFSDVSLFVGQLAHDSIDTRLLGGDPETGISYTEKFFDNSLSLGLSFDVGADQSPSQTSYSDTVLKKDFKLGTSAVYTMNDHFKAGLSYNLAEYRMNPNQDDSTNLGRRVGHSVIGGVSYNDGATLIGLTASYQNYNYNAMDVSALNPVASASNEKNNIWGLSVGATYDFSGVGLGFMPIAQFEFKKDYLKNTLIADSSESKKSYVKTQALELGFSYNVTRNLQYIAAAVIDLRSKKQVQDADLITTGKSNGDKYTSHHFFGAGVKYTF